MTHAGKALAATVLGVAVGSSGALAAQIDHSGATVTITGPTTMTVNGVTATGMAGEKHVDLQWDAQNNVYKVVGYREGNAGCAAGSDYTDPVTGMEFVCVPAGTFHMGDVFGGGDSDESPAHRVTLARGFYLGKTEVTQAQWQAVGSRSNPSRFASCGADCPVEQVSWDDAQAYIADLNALNGHAGCLRGDSGCYSLPTEAQWEYSASYGSAGSPEPKRKYSGTSYDARVGDYAWFSANSGGMTHPVGTRLPNALGLYDLSGNVDEWVQDWYGVYPSGSQLDPTGPSSGYGYGRVVRGGSWFSRAEDVRTAFRGWQWPSSATWSYGFRLLLAP